MCAALGLDPVDDQSNRSPAIRRNRIRHELLPLAADIAARDVAPILARTADLLRDEQRLLDALAAALDPTDARPLAAADPALARRAVRRWLTVDGYPPDAAAIERVLAVARGDADGVRAAGRAPGRTVRQRFRIIRRRRTSIIPRNAATARSLQPEPLMPPKLRGKWALGITPRHFTWILKDKLAICERPGGYGDSHRRVRRQEEIIWIRENGFNYVISIIQAPHNLHNYEELNLPYRHRPFKADDRDAWLRAFYREIDDLIRNGHEADRARRGARRPARGHHGRLHPLGRPRRGFDQGDRDHRAPHRPPARPVRPRRHHDRRRAAAVSGLTPRARRLAPLRPRPPASTGAYRSSGYTLQVRGIASSGTGSTARSKRGPGRTSKCRW